LAFWPVIHHDGTFRATDERGQPRPITMGGEPVRGLNPGWSPLGLQTGLAPIHLLELRHEDPGEPDAVWYLGEGAGERLEFLANHPARLPPEASERIISRLLPLLRDIHEITLCGPRPDAAPTAGQFRGINPAFVSELVAHVAGQALTPPDCVSIARFSGLSDHYMTDGLRLSLPVLDILLAPLPVVSGMSIPEVPSPLGGGPLRAQESRALTDLAPGDLVAHRFFDRRAGLSFYLLVAAAGTPRAVLFIPALNLAFARDEPPHGRALLAGLLAQEARRATTGAAQAGTAGPPRSAPLPPMPPARRRWKILSGSGAA